LVSILFFTLFLFLISSSNFHAARFFKIRIWGCFHHFVKTIFFFLLVQYLNLHGVRPTSKQFITTTILQLSTCIWLNNRIQTNKQNKESKMKQTNYKHDTQWGVPFIRTSDFRRMHLSSFRAPVNSLIYSGFFSFFFSLFRVYFVKRVDFFFLLFFLSFWNLKLALSSKNVAASSSFPPF